MNRSFALLYIMYSECSWLHLIRMYIHCEWIYVITISAVNNLAHGILKVKLSHVQSQYRQQEQKVALTMAGRQGPVLQLVLVLLTQSTNNLQTWVLQVNLAGLLRMVVLIHASSTVGTPLLHNNQWEWILCQVIQVRDCHWLSTRWCVLHAILFVGYMLKAVTT